MVLKRIGIAILVLLIIIVLVIMVSFIIHRIKLTKEAELFVPPGQIVNVNGYDMHVYAEGDADAAKTLVFMSGSGTPSPYLDFKSLYSILSEKYRTVVVEKIGYGFSEVADVERDIDSMLSDTREALTLAGIEGPYVLCPHSMSGIEAIYWAQKYPAEVEAIIGLDITVPASYRDHKLTLGMIKFGKFVADLGLTRWFPSLAESDAALYGSLTEAEKELSRAIFYLRTGTKTMVNEIEAIKENSAALADEGLVDKPMLLFLSTGEVTGWEEATWRAFILDYAAKLENGILIEVNSPHSVHNHKYKELATEIDSYLSELGD
ncbi:MAG: alpha/beta hydrolase [Eubacteriales bacterium]|nr:alpha/beta hydrolase [Eubacteriales bacterium]MDD4541881.1 alpha/beta hydrolase [Eubacteriales bacterium]